MESRLPIWRQLGWRLGAAFLLLTAIGSLTSSFLQYKSQDRQLRQSMGSRLLNITRTGAVLLDGDLHQTVVEAGRTDTPQYQTFRRQLQKIQKANRLREPLYTLIDVNGKMARFAVVSYGDEEVGKPYELAPEIQPILRRVLAENTVAYTDIYENEHGSWMTAFAPVLNSAGQTVAVLDVDYRADVFLAELRTIRHRLYIHSLSAALLALVVGLFLAQQITRPVVQLSASVRRVMEGDLTTRVQIASRDEIGMLGDAFNHMVVGLKERESMRSAQVLMKQQLESARVIQESFLPTILPGANDPRFSLAAFNHPAASVGGDYYDVISITDNRVGLVIGDVSGKGVPGAIYMARLVSDFRFLVNQPETSPGKIFTALNRILFERGQSGMFITLFYLELNLDTGEATLSNAGHPPMLVRRSSGVVDEVDWSAGPPLGILEEFPYANAPIILAPKEDILLYTDGVTEAMNEAREQFSYERLVEMCRHGYSSPDELVEAVSREVESFTKDAPPHDDLTILAARWEGGILRYGTIEVENRRAHSITESYVNYNEPT